MSRKKQNIQKITALYCRLSLEDGRENESMSISNQKLMLKDFAEKNGMFRYEYYVDDGYTGRNFNRPAFQRMIADIEAGKIDCVITKDLSRLGRNYIEAGSYIEIFFPKHHIRYIAITDGVDSLTRQEMDITPFKNILNDMYSRDISKKVLAGIMTRSRQGKFCGGTPPYGLMRDPKAAGRENPHYPCESKYGSGCQLLHMGYGKNRPHSPQSVLQGRTSRVQDAPNGHPFRFVQIHSP